MHLELKKININLTVQKNNIKKQNKAIQKKLDNMVNQNQDYEKYVLRQQQMTQSENKYYSTIFLQIKSKVKDSTNILQRFTFSQQMMENLINDLLDLAKLENN